MSEPRTNQQVEQTLASWMDDVAPGRAPSRLLEETFARTMEARQARTYPWHAAGIGTLGGGSVRQFARPGVLVVVALVVTALAIGLSVGGFRSLTPPLPSASPTFGPTSTPTARPLPSSIALLPDAVIAVANPGWQVFDGSTLWVTTSSNLVSRIDVTTNAITVPQAFLDPGKTVGSFATNGVGVWVSDSASNVVYRLDPATLKLVAEIPVGAHPGGLSVGNDAVWVANLRDGSVSRIDPATNTVVTTVIVGTPGPGGPHVVDTGLDSLWVSAGSGPDGSGGTVVRIDPVTNLIQATIQIPANASACGGFAIAADAVWMSSCFDQKTLVRIDPSTNTVAAAIDVGGYVGGMFLVDGVLWFALETEADALPARIVRVDPSTNTIDRVLSLGDAYRGEGLLIADGSVWAQDMANDQVLRLPLAAFQH